MINWGFSHKLKEEKFESEGHMVFCCDKKIEIELDAASFNRVGYAEFSLEQNTFTIIVKRKDTCENSPMQEVKPVADGKVSISNTSGYTDNKTDAVGDKVKDIEKEIKLTPNNPKMNLNQPDESLQEKKPLRYMIFDNVSWKEPHSMTIDEFSSLNEKYRYGGIDNLKEEVVELEEGIVVLVTKDKISVNSDKWQPKKGGDGGRFEVVLPINGIKLSLFVIRPVSELLVYKDVSPDVPYPKKPDDKVGSGRSGSFKWVYGSVRGPSHRNSDQLCRDDDVNVLHDCANDTLYLAVADGAGSAKYAREGSRIAVEEMVNYFRNKPLPQGMFDSSNGCQVVRQEIHHAVLAVLGKIDKRAEEVSLEQNEPGLTRRNFHTTLNFAVIQRDVKGDFKVISFAVGDGAIMFCHSEGNYKPLSVADRGEFASQTAFITIKGLIPLSDNFINREFYEKRFSGATITADEMRNGYLALMTDGVSEDVGNWGEFILETKDVIQKLDGRALVDLLNGQVERNLDDKTLVLVSSNLL